VKKVKNVPVSLGSYGRWAFAEFTEVYQMESDFQAKVEAEFNRMIEGIAKSDVGRVKGEM
jgi:hypothetical protein